MFTPAVAVDFKSIVKTLLKGKHLPDVYRDHALAGQFLGYRECHIKGDLLLVYQKDSAERIIDLTDIGTHSQLFG